LNQKITVKAGASAPTPSERIVTVASETFTATDSQGRIFTLKDPDILVQLDLIEVLGDLAENNIYRNVVTPITYVAAIDGNPAPFPKTVPQLRALISRIGFHGFAAIRQAVKDRHPAVEDEAQAEATETDALKK